MMELSEYLDASRRDAERLVAVAAKAGLDAAVPTCPGWNVGDLVRHVGGLARGVIFYLDTGHLLPPAEAETRAWFASPPPDRELLDWYLDVRGTLDAAFLAADPAMDCFSFLPAPSPLLFWARRDAHETAIHRVDTELAAAVEIVPFASSFAIDGIGELLSFVTSGGSLAADPAVTLRIEAGVVWTVLISPTGGRVAPDTGEADCVVAGSAHDLYVALWNRRDLGGLNVMGDPGVLDIWRAGARWEL